MRTALTRFAQWCIATPTWWFSWDLSWLSAIAIGAHQTKTPLPWADAILDAFLAGAWMLFWTEDTLYWVAKPQVYTEPTALGRRLHRADGPAVTSDVEPLYFWHGVLVPPHVIEAPETITPEEVTSETNAEVRRVLLERFGADRYIAAIGAAPIDQSDYGTLYRVEIAEDEPLVMVRLVNSTPEADGSFKEYWLRVPPDMERARQAVAWTFGMEESAYAPVAQS